MKGGIVMLYYISNPAYGLWDNTLGGYSCVGGLSDKPKRPKDGHWCPHCFKKKLFSWLENDWCKVCKNVSSINDEEVKEIMKER